MKEVTIIRMAGTRLRTVSRSRSWTPTDILSPPSGPPTWTLTDGSAPVPAPEPHPPSKSPTWPSRARARVLAGAATSSAASVPRRRSRAVVDPKLLDSHPCPSRVPVPGSEPIPHMLTAGSSVSGGREGPVRGSHRARDPTVRPYPLDKRRRDSEAHGSLTFRLDRERRASISAAPATGARARTRS